MNPASPEPDATLAIIAEAQPRNGLEQRMLAHLRHAPPAERTSRLLTPRVAITTLSITAVLFVAAATLPYRRMHPATAFVPAHLALQSGAVSASTAVVAAARPIRPAVPGRAHRFRAVRAQHTRVPLPRGVVLAQHRNLRALPH